MTLSETFEVVGPSVVAFVSKGRMGRTGEKPLLPRFFGSGFLVDKDGIVATNGHIVEEFEKLRKHPETGEPGLGAILFVAVKDERGQSAQQMFVVDVKGWLSLDNFTSSGNWYGRPVPDLGFVQLDICETSYLQLATEPFYVKPGMPIATAGYPLGDDALTIFNKITQLGPFLRHGIISSVFPFTSEQPHGFSIDIMQQGGSSGSPIFRAEEPLVVGMMSSSLNDWKRVETKWLQLNVAQNTNISIAEPAAVIRGALDGFRQNYPMSLTGVPTLEERIVDAPKEERPPTWSSWTMST